MNTAIIDDRDLRAIRLKRNRLRRQRQLHRRMAIAVCALIIIIVSSFGLTSILSRASEDDGRAIVYTSVMIPYGTTLSQLGEEYMDSAYYDSLEQYIRDVRFINNLDSDEIIAGHYLIMPVIIDRD